MSGEAGTGTATKETPAAGTPGGENGQGQQPQPTLLGNANAPGAAGESKPGEAGDAGDKGKPGADDKGNAEGAGTPAEGYKFNLPDGLEFDKDTVSAFSALAKKSNMSQESAQEIVDLQVGMVKKVQEQSAKDYQDQQSQWQADTKKAFGADFDKKMSFAAKTRDAFFTQEVKDLFEITGMGNHPVINQLMATIGEAIGEDRLVKGGSGAVDTSGMTAQEKIAAEYRRKEAERKK